jgi:hypothetical protein
MPSFVSKHASLIASLAGASVGLVSLACGNAEGATNTPPVETPVVEAPVVAPPAEARASWDEPSFLLRSEPVGAFQAGTESHLAIRLEARGDHHVNQDYPISIQITAPEGVTLPHATLGRPEAAEFSEALARFDVPFTATAGHHELRALVDFAVCTPESCMPDTRTLAIAIDVP